MKYIFHCEPDDFILAGRAVKSFLADPLIANDCVISFGNGQSFYVRRNKASVTVYDNRKETS